VEMPFSERRVAIAGFADALSIEYITAGDGPPLVLLHGVGDSAHSWQWVLPTLARTHRVYAPSLPGFGASSKPAINYSPAFFTTCLIAFLDALGLEQAVVVGNSLGGLVAMRLALAVPDRVTALGLADSAGLGRKITLAMRVLTLRPAGGIVTRWNKTSIGARQWAMQMAGLLFAHPTYAPRDWVEQVYRMARTPGYLEATVSTVRSGSTLRGQRKHEIMLADLPKLTMPTLIIWGERDRVVPVHQAHEAAKRLPNGRLAVIPDCGHLPHIERPDQFVRALDQFLTEHALVQPAHVSL